MRWGLLLASLLLTAPGHAEQRWQQIQNEARGQTVWFNAWGGDTAVNQYLDWVSGEMKTHYAVTLKIVRLADAADAVKRIQTEAAAGRNTGGSVDLLIRKSRYVKIYRFPLTGLSHRGVARS